MQDAHADQVRIVTFPELLQNPRHDTVDLVGGCPRCELEFIGEAAGDLLFSVHENMLAPAASTAPGVGRLSCS